MADVNITIGAAFDQLSSAVNGAKSSLETLETGVRAISAALGITLFAEFISHMTEIAEQAERTAAVLGVSTVAVQELTGVSQIFGGSAQTLTVSLERLQLNLQRGQQLTSQQAQALKALGLSAQQVASVPVDRQVGLFADAVKRLNDQGINPANALLPLFGRGVTTMIPLLAQGSAGVDAWKQRLIEVGSVMTSQTNTALSELGHEMSLLKLGLGGLGETILNEFAEPLKTAAKAIGEWIGHLANLNQAVGLGTYLTGYFTRWLELLTAEMNKDAEATAAAQKALADYNAETEQAIVHLKEIIVQQAAADAKRSAAFSGPNRDVIKQADENYRRMSELIKADFDTFSITEQQKTERLKVALRDRYAAEVNAGDNEKTAKLKLDADIAKLDAEAGKKIADEWKKVADQFASDFSSAVDSVLTKQTTFAQAMTKMFAKMIEQMIADLIKLIAEYTLLSLVAGSALAPKMAAPNFAALAGGTFPLLGGLLGGGGAGGAAGSAAGQAANTAALTTLTTAVGIHTAATTTDTAATVTDTAATGVQTTVTGANTVAQSGTAAAWLANTTATIANTIATWAKAFVPAETGLWNVGTPQRFPSFEVGSWKVGAPQAFPSYQSGTSSVPGTQLALLHAGEMVVPAGPAQAIREGGGGGQNVSLSINAIDARSIANMFLSNKTVLQAVLTQIARANPGAFTRFGTNSVS